MSKQVFLIQQVIDKPQCTAVAANPSTLCDDYTVAHNHISSVIFWSESPVKDDFMLQLDLAGSMSKEHCFPVLHVL